MSRYYYHRHRHDDYDDRYIPVPYGGGGGELGGCFSLLALAAFIFLMFAFGMASRF